MDQGGRGNDSVAIRTGIGNVKRRRAAGDVHVHWQNLTFNWFPDLAFEPRPKPRALRPVASFGPGHAQFQFQNAGP